MQLKQSPASSTSLESRANPRSWQRKVRRDKLSSPAAGGQILGVLKRIKDSRLSLRRKHAIVGFCSAKARFFRGKRKTTMVAYPWPFTPK